MWPMHLWLFSCWIIPNSAIHTRAHTCTHAHPSLSYKDWKNGYGIGECARFPKIVLRDHFRAVFRIGHFRPVLLVCKVNVFIPFPLGSRLHLHAWLRWTPVLKGRAWYSSSLPSSLAFEQAREMHKFSKGSGPKWWLNWHHFTFFMLCIYSNKFQARN